MRVGIIGAEPMACVMDERLDPVLRAVATTRTDLCVGRPGPCGAR